MEWKVTDFVFDLTGNKLLAWHFTPSRGRTDVSIFARYRAAQHQSFCVRSAVVGPFPLDRPTATFLPRRPWRRLFRTFSSFPYISSDVCSSLFCRWAFTHLHDDMSRCHANRCWFCPDGVSPWKRNIPENCWTRMSYQTVTLFVQEGLLGRGCERGVLVLGGVLPLYDSVGWIWPWLDFAFELIGIGVWLSEFDLHWIWGWP